MANKFMDILGNATDEITSALPPLEQQPEVPEVNIEQPKPVAAGGINQSATTGKPAKVSNPASLLPPPQLMPLFEDAARKNGVPVNVLMALAHQESRYNARAVGQPTQWGRATGMMQYLDSTASGLGINPLDPQQAVNAAAKQLRERLNKGYSMEEAIAAHFAGDNRRQWGVKTARYGLEVANKAGQIADLIQPQETFAKQDAPKPRDTSTGLLAAIQDPNVQKIAGAAAMGLLSPISGGAPAPVAGDSSYLGASLRAGGYDLLGAGAKILDEINPFTLSPSDAAVLFKNDPNKLKDFQDNSAAMVLSRFANTMQKWSEDEMASVKPEDQAKYGKLKYATTDWNNSAFSEPTKVLGDAVRSLPTMAALAVTTYLTKGAASRAEATALANGATQAEARAIAIEAGKKMAARSGAVSEGSVGYAQQANSTASDVEKAMAKDPTKSPLYMQLLREGFSPEAAKAKVIADTAQQSGMYAGLVDSVVNKVGGEFLGKILTEGGPFIKRVMSGAANEGATELAQSGGEQLGQNMATQANVNPGQSLSEGVGESMIQGLAVGGLSGGVTAGAFGERPQKTDAQILAEEIKKGGDNYQPTMGGLNPLSQPDSIIDPRHTAQNVGGFSANPPVPEGFHKPDVQPTEIDPITDKPKGVLTKALESGLANATLAEHADLGDRLNAGIEAGNVQNLSEDNNVPTTGNLPDANVADQTESVPSDVAPEAKAEVEAKKPETLTVKPLSEMTDSELKDRRAYLISQAKTNGGWTTTLHKERVAVENEQASREENPAPAEESSKPNEVDQSYVMTINHNGAPISVKFDKPVADMTAADIGRAVKKQGLKDFAPQFEAEHAKQFPVADAGAKTETVEQDSYSDRYKKRIEAIKAAKSPEEVSAILDQEYSDNERHMEGMGLVERETRQRNRDFESEAAKKKEQEAIDRGEWVDVSGSGRGSRSAAENIAIESRKLNDGFEYEATTDYSGGWMVRKRKKPSAQDAKPTVKESLTTPTAEKVPEVAPTKKASKEELNDLFGVDKKRKAAIERIEKGTAYFSTPEKAQDWIKKNGIADTHEVKQTGKVRFNVVAKEGDGAGAPVAGTPEAPAFTKDQVSEAFNKANDTIKNEALKAGSLEEKKAAQLKVTAAEATLRKMRTSIFDAEDAAIEAIKTGNPSAFADHADVFSDAAKEIESSVAAKSESVTEDKATPESNYGNDNKLVSKSRADELAAKLRAKMGQLNSGIDPEMLAIGTELAVYHLEAGTREFVKFAKVMAEHIGVSIEQAKPYLRSFYNGARDMMEDHNLDVSGMDSPDVVRDKLKNLSSSDAEVRNSAEQQAAQSDNASLVKHFSDLLADGNMPKDNRELKKMVADFDGSEPSQERMKQAQEDLEAAIVVQSRNVVAKGGNSRATYDDLVKLYQSQPNLNIRSSTSIENQAYSTPAPLAYLASQLAGINASTTVYEPTAGNGMLLIGADPKNATANELEDQRYSNLLAQGFDAIQGDALDVIKSGALMAKSQDAVISNPPFGSIKNADGEVIKVPVDGYQIGKIDHLIAADALNAMKDDGKAVLILGADKVAGGLSKDDRLFFNWLYSHYNVTNHFEVDGKLYNRQGAGWPIRVISINGRVDSSNISPRQGTVQRVNTWEQVYEQFEQGLVSQSQPINRDTASDSNGAVSGQQGANESANPESIDAGQTKVSSGRKSTGSASRVGNVGGERTGATGNRSTVPTEGVAEPDSQQRGDEQTVVDGGLEAGSKGRDASSKTGSGKPGGNTGSPSVNVLSDADNAYQTKYVPASSRKDEGVLIPINMATPLRDALNKLEDEVGDIDQYAAKELGYASTDELHDALMGLQVDSVASAINQLGKGKGTIIADQTGIGKGRQAASIIRWAKKNGKVPVFVTVKPSLFTDMHNDLNDIGSNDIVPFIINKDESVSGKDGEKLFANDKNHKSLLQQIAGTGELPEGRNAVFMTYSQINTANMQRAAIAQLASNAVFILDESHNAGGQSSTGEYIKSVLESASGVVYLSATYAKRPDNMPVYFRTDIGDAISDEGALAEAMAAGGLPLQTVVSNNLVKSGQMFRRERSYDGVSIETKVATDKTAEHEGISDKITSALRAIVDADRTFHEVFFKEAKAEAEATGGDAYDSVGNNAQNSVDHTEFSAVVHNFVRQFLLGLKADSAAEEAIAALKRDEKPLIAVDNTMGSFLSEYAANGNLKAGDSLGAFDYRTVLSRALERSRYLSVMDEKGNKVKKYIAMSDLDPVTRAAYENAQEVINSLDIANIPVSPIDWIRSRIQKAGFSVAEITGRDLAVDYSSGKPILTNVPVEERTDKVATTRRFNGGSLDAIILNVSGSTGISLHASEKFSDQRQRHMIIAQAAQDINIFMQMLGRIHRTGQVKLPKYTILNVDLPAEKRPTALLSKKMKSLNANTSSNTESATSVEAVDLMNKYGDQVIGNYLNDNPKLKDAIGIDAAADNDGKMPEDIARKATGRVALLPVETQKSFYAEVEGQYQELIDYLNKTNQNDLEPRTFDFDAEETANEVLLEPKSDNAFGEGANYVEYSIKAQGKAMTPDEIQQAMDDHLSGKTPSAHASDLVSGLDGKYKEFVGGLDDPKQIAEAEGVAAKARRFIADHAIGSMWRVEINGDIYNAVVTNLKNSHKASGNPYSFSKTSVTLALNGALRSVTVPATQFERIVVSPLYRQPLRSAFEVRQTNEREKAKIITGNLLAAYGELRDASGSIINFSKKDGSIEQGILLPKTFDFKKNTAGDVRLKSASDVVRFLQQSTHNDTSRFGVVSRDGVVRVKPDGRKIEIIVPKSKARGGKYFSDKSLTALTGGFYSSGQMMSASVPFEKATEAIDYLMKKTALYAMPSQVREVKRILGDSEGKYSAGNGIDKYSASAPKVKQSILNGFDGLVKSLVDSGKVVIFDSQADSPYANRNFMVKGATLPDGTIHLVTSNLADPAAANGVLLHEMFHAGGEKLLGTSEWNSLLKDLGSIYRQAERSSGRARAIFDHAREHLDKVKEDYRKNGIQMGDSLTAEEFGAYAIEIYENLPAAYRSWVDRVIGHVKAWLRKRFGMQLGQVTPAQVRSIAMAALRNGTGANGNPNGGISYSAGDVNESENGIKIEDQTRLNKIQEYMQDSMNRVKDIQESITKATGLKIEERSDFYGANERMPGRIASRLEDGRNIFTPIINKLAKAGYTLADLESLLHAMHAKERNDYIAQVNPEHDPNSDKFIGVQGSGMNDEDAYAILNKYKDAKDLHALADDVRSVAAKTLEMKNAYGIINDADYEHLQGFYENYVPLKGDIEPKSARIKKALGHGERDERILDNIMRDYEQAVVQGERNVAKQHLLSLILENPDSKLWTVGVIPKGRTLVPSNVYNVTYHGSTVEQFRTFGEAQAFINGSNKEGYEIQDERGQTIKYYAKPVQDNEVVLFVKGDQVRIQVHDEVLARQLNRMNHQQLNMVNEIMRSSMRWLSHVYTGYNPTFIMTNTARDATTGMINIMGNQGIGIAARSAKNYASAAAMLGKFATKSDLGDSKMAQYFKEYRAHGGKTGASYMSDLEAQAKSIQATFDDAYGAGKFAAEGKVGKAAVVSFRKTIGGLAHIVEVANQVSENAMRLSLYASMRDAGHTPAEAAQAAKNVTVNFDKKGAATNVLGSMYLFINPRIQGTANAIRTLTKGAHKEQAWAALAGFASLGFYLAAKGMGEDKDWWLGHDWEQRRQKLIMKVGDTTLNLPLSQEFSPFFAFGTALAEGMHGESKFDTSSRLMASFINTIAPFDLAHPDSNNQTADLFLSLVPTLAKPGIEVAMNRSNGRRIYPESTNSPDMPDNQKMNRGTKGSMFESASNALAAVGELAGAGKYQNDISKVSPETLKYLWRTYTGGLGSFIADSGQLAMNAGSGTELNDVPILKAFVKDDTHATLQSRFYDLKDKAAAAAAEFSQAKKLKDFDESGNIMDKQGDLIALSKMMTRYNKAIANLKDQAVEINQDESMSKADKRAALKSLEKEEDSLYKDAIAAFR